MEAPEGAVEPVTSAQQELLFRIAEGQVALQNAAAALMAMAAQPRQQIVTVQRGPDGNIVGATVDGGA
jgi:hypothetical protein